jgi:hypothetical protein
VAPSVDVNGKGPVVLLGAVATAAVIAAVVFAILYFRDTSSGEPAAQACGDRIFGHIASLSPNGDQYEMRFDPAWFTSGVTANTAAAEDGVVEPGEPVPNDNYRVEEGHRLLTYLVPRSAHVTVLTRQGDPAGFGATPISVSELAQLVDGEKPVELFELLDSGIWASYHVDTVCSLDQQYQP